MSTSTTTGYTTRQIRPDDYPIWSELWRSYLDFYSTNLPESQHQDTFQRLITSSTYNHIPNDDPDTSTSTPHFIPGNIYALLLISPSSEPIGLAHYLFHPSTWTPSPIAHCYLNDLYIHPNHRGKNLADLLIREVEALVKRGGKGRCKRLYWLTQPGNVRARKVYDRVCATGGDVREGGEEEEEAAKPRTGGLMDRVAYKIDL